MESDEDEDVIFVVIY